MSGGEMKPIMARLIGLGALAIVMLLCVWIHAPKIEAALAERARAVVAEMHADWAGIEADGRDIIVHGTAPDRDVAARLRQAIENIPGVRSVSFEATALAAAETAPRSASESSIAASQQEEQEEAPPVSGEAADTSTASDTSSATAAMPTQDDSEPLPLAHCQQQVDALLADNPLHFRKGSAALQEGSKKLLDRMAVALAACPGTKLTITGHTDSRGDATSNQRLSETRAMAVADYLAVRGVAKERITTRGAGESEPVADNATAAGRARNRRIEITLEGGVE